MASLNIIQSAAPLRPSELSARDGGDRYSLAVPAHFHRQGCRLGGVISRSLHQAAGRLWVLKGQGHKTACDRGMFSRSLVLRSVDHLQLHRPASNAAANQGLHQ